MTPKGSHKAWKPQAVTVARPLLDRGVMMTRYDRTWEPLVVLIAAAIVWFGTL